MKETIYIFVENGTVTSVESNNKRRLNNFDLKIRVIDKDINGNGVENKNINRIISWLNRTNKERVCLW